MNIQFERRVQGKLKLESWVDVSTLDPRVNPVQDVCSRGFHVPEDGRGLEFNVGNIKFPPGSSGRVCNVVKCSVFVSVSLCRASKAACVAQAALAPLAGRLTLIGDTHVVLWPCVCSVGAARAVAIYV